MRADDEVRRPIPSKDVVARDMEIMSDKYEAVGQAHAIGRQSRAEEPDGGGRHGMITFEEYKKGVEPYTLDSSPSSPRATWTSH